MDTRIFGMFLNWIQPNRLVHLDGIQRIELLAHLPMKLQQQIVVGLDHFVSESGKKIQKDKQF